MDKLLALGFHCVAGQIDRDGINYGFLTQDGPVLTPEGEELVKSLSKKPRRASANPDAIPESAPTDVVETPAAE